MVVRVSGLGSVAAGMGGVVPVPPPVVGTPAGADDVCSAGAAAVGVWVLADVAVGPDTCVALHFPLICLTSVTEPSADVSTRTSAAGCHVAVAPFNCWV